MTGRGDRGSAVVWLLLLLPALFLFAGLVLDGGRVITARQEAANLAEQAARVAVDAVDQGALRGAATAAAGPADTAGAAAAVAAGCGYVTAARAGASCTGRAQPGGRVQMSVSITTRTAVLAAVGVWQVTVDGTGTARPAVGATEEVP